MPEQVLFQEVSQYYRKKGIITFTDASDVKQLQTTNFAKSDYIVPFNCIRHKIWWVASKPLME